VDYGVFFRWGRGGRRGSLRPPAPSWHGGSPGGGEEGNWSWWGLGCGGLGEVWEGRRGETEGHSLALGGLGHWGYGSCGKGPGGDEEGNGERGLYRALVMMRVGWSMTERSSG